MDLTIYIYIYKYTVTMSTHVYLYQWHKINDDEFMKNIHMQGHFKTSIKRDEDDMANIQRCIDVLL